MRENFGFNISTEFNKFLVTQIGTDSEWKQLISHYGCYNQEIRHGFWQDWQNIIQELPFCPVDSTVVTNNSAITVCSGNVDILNSLSIISGNLKLLRPWRKGPYSLFGIEIDSEWRSDIKWNRLFSHIKPLTNLRVLDVGTGNGYHLWRMLGAGAKVAIGLEPTILSFVQFLAVLRLMGVHPLWIFPTTLESFDRKPMFDTVFSMGVLYHRRHPLSHIQELVECLRPGGELVLETLVIPGDSMMCLVPADRYAGMRNVWFLPSVSLLLIWLNRLGLVNPRLVSCEPTTPEEQRQTDWLGDKPSLVDVLDSADMTRTIEGYPAPLRAIFLAEKSMSSG